jgi:hypothetical protein
MSEVSDVRFHVDTFLVACNNNFVLFFFPPGTVVCSLDTFEKNPLLEVDRSDLSLDLLPDIVDHVYSSLSEVEDYDDASRKYSCAGNLICCNI